MKSGINTRNARWLVAAGLALGIAAAGQAANGFSITQSQEAAITVGMTQSQVEQALGRPARVVNYPFALGPTWLYNVEYSTFGATEFDVNFGGDDKVISASERVLGDN